MGFLLKKYVYKKTISQLEKGIMVTIMQNSTLPLANTNLFKQAIVYQEPKLWNSITANIINKVSVPTFKTALNKHLLIIENNTPFGTAYLIFAFVLNF